MTEVYKGHTVKYPSNLSVNSLEKFGIEINIWAFFSTLPLHVTQPIMEQIKRENTTKLYNDKHSHSGVDVQPFIRCFVFHFVAFTTWLEPQQYKL